MQIHLKYCLSLIIIGMTLIICPSWSFASEGQITRMPSKEEVSPYHQWSIYFNTPLKANLVNQENIYVLNEGGETVPVTFNLVGQHLTIIPPEDGYDLGSHFKLIVENDIESKQGHEASTSTIMEFDTTSDYSPLTKEKVKASSEGKSLYINGEAEDAFLFSYNQMTYIPLEQLLKGMGDHYEVGESFATIQLSGDKTSYQVYAGRNVLYKGDEAIPLTINSQKGEDVPGSSRVLKIDGQLFVPIRTVAEVFDYSYSTKREDDVTQYHFGEAGLTTQEQNSEKTYANPMDVPLLNQMNSPQLYNGCEVTSLAMILLHHGIEVSKNELAQSVAKVPLTYSNGLKGNPNQGFVGDMQNGPGLSVYHEPMMDLAESYVGNRSVDLTGSKADQLYHYIDEGLPVWVITTTTLAPVHNFQTWHTPQGKIDVTFSVHSVVITGYNDQYVYINNPYGQKNQKVNRDQFEQAWKQMGQQAIVIKREKNQS